MAKKTVNEIIDILKKDIEENYKLLTPKFGLLAIASANNLAYQYKNGKLLINNPLLVFNENPKYLRNLIVELYNDRIDYDDVIKKINDINLQQNENIKNSNINASSNNPAMTSILARMIGYDLFMLTLFCTVYKKSLPIDLWKKISNNSNKKECQKLIRLAYSMENMPNVCGKLNANFDLPEFIYS